MKVRIKRVGAHALPLPAYETAGAAGMDLRTLQPFTINALSRVKVGCGFAFEIPDCYEGQVRPRSGLTWKSGVVVMLGTIDADYRGEVCVTLFNMTDRPALFEAGDRIAQLVIAPVVRATLEEVAELSDTARGGNGFGSSGTR